MIRYFCVNSRHVQESLILGLLGWADHKHTHTPVCLTIDRSGEVSVTTSKTVSLSGRGRLLNFVPMEIVDQYRKLYSDLAAQGYNLFNNNIGEKNCWVVATRKESALKEEAVPGIIKTIAVQARSRGFNSEEIANLQSTFLNICQSVLKHDVSHELRATVEGGSSIKFG